jgi:uncharacterized membrane protein|tara:strand:- start:260 stop:757 length:498 start_codon:yes stop_codon:yes gene_type:complete
MRAIAHALGTGSRAASYMLGGLVLALAIAVGTTASNTADIAHWARDVLGITFVTLLGGLIFIAVLAWVKLCDRGASEATVRTWLEAGVQAANGVTTLALTYTLFGISLGIGSLAEATLTPETVHGIIKTLTANFSLAFMTTVVGLPVSALLRALLLITHARRAER